MSFRDRNKRKSRSVKEIYARREKRCERCGRKIKMGRYCYSCGKHKGLW